MSEVVIDIEHLSKRYRLGVLSTGTLTRDLQRWWEHKRDMEEQHGFCRGRHG